MSEFLDVLATLEWSEAAPSAMVVSGVKSRIARSVSRASRRLPPGWRLAVVSRLPRRVTPLLVEAAHQDRAFWDREFADGDPFGFDRSADERLKFEYTLELCGEGPFERGLEIGCAMGAFTELLAPRCSELLAVDISENAVQTARDRLRRFAQVRCEAKTLPAEFPSGHFDLVVASDVFYYWPPEDIVACLTSIEVSLAPGGTFVAAHYEPPMGALLDGAEVHDLLGRHTTLEVEISESKHFGVNRPYRINRYRKLRLPSPAEPRVDAGLVEELLDAAQSNVAGAGEVVLEEVEAPVRGK